MQQHILIEILQMLWLFLERSVVQAQIGALAMALAVAWTISWRIRKLVCQRFRRWIYRHLNDLHQQSPIHKCDSSSLYEIGMQALVEQTPTDHPRYDDVLECEQRLLEYRKQAFKNETRPAIIRERIALVNQLDGLSQAILGIPFHTLYRRHTPRRVRWGMLLGRYLPLPLLSIVTLHAARVFLLWQDWVFVGLLDYCITLLWIILVYRLFILLIYSLFRERSVRYYHYRLLAPSFGLFMGVIILANLVGVGNVFRLLETNVFTSQWTTNPVTLGGIVQNIIGIYLWFHIANLIKDILRGFIVPRTTTAPGAVNAALSIAHTIAIALGIYVLLSNLGFNTSTIAFVSGGLSVGIGFGMQKIFSNLVSGIVLLFEQSLRPGDVVVIDGTMGIVDSLGIRATTIQTFDNVKIIVPNENIFTSSVTTYTSKVTELRVLIGVGTSYYTNPHTVLEILLAIAQRHPLVLKEPEPLAWLMEFKDSRMEFQLAVWITDVMMMKTVASDLRVMILSEFEHHNITIPFPQHDLHIRTSVPLEIHGKGQGQEDEDEDG
jgi:small-conductance mechanosensitive channel